MKAGLIAGMVAIAAAAFACSSSNSNGGSNASCVTNSSGSNSACTSCVENSCGSQLSAVESGCSDFINCACQNGMINDNMIQACESKEMESSCTNAIGPLSSCETAHCQSQCTTSGSSSGGGSGSGSGSSSGGTGLSNFSCYLPSSGVCTQAETTSSELSAQQSACTQESGTFGTSTCPTAGLVGCCLVSGFGSCYYNASAAMQAQSGCASPATWSTTP